MADIEFSTTEKEQIVARLKKYFDEELNQEIGQFDAEFLLDFIARELGPFFYNRGLYDAQALMQDKVNEISEAIFEIEKQIPTA